LRASECCAHPSRSLVIYHWIIRFVCQSIITPSELINMRAIPCSLLSIAVSMLATTSQSYAQSQITYGSYISVQMNVDDNGNNILGDAAHEPTIAFDPNNPDKLVAGWKHFASVFSGSREGGWGFSDDGGKHWHFQGFVTPGEQRTNNMVDVDLLGNFYY
jgi:hypothetical protein